jgi:hypothetical protein
MRYEAMVYIQVDAESEDAARTQLEKGLGLFAAYDIEQIEQTDPAPPTPGFDNAFANARSAIERFNLTEHL